MHAENPLTIINIPKHEPNIHTLIRNRPIFQSLLPSEASNHAGIIISGMHIVIRITLQQVIGCTHAVPVTTQVLELLFTLLRLKVTMGFAAAS